MKISLLRQLPLVVFLSVVALALPARGQRPSSNLDQQQPLVDASKNTTFAVGGASEQKLAQTFTVGLPGRLTEVRFPIGCADGMLSVEIQGTTPAGEPDGVVLLRRSIRANRLPTVVPGTFEPLRLGGGLRVAPGDHLAIVLSNSTGSCGVALGPDGDAYLDGRSFFDARPNLPGWIPISSSSPEDDLPFQTFVFGRL